VLVTLGDWYHIDGLGDRGPSKLAVVIVEAEEGLSDFVYSLSSTMPEMINGES
jgi:hypothetical protein